MTVFRGIDVPAGDLARLPWRVGRSLGFSVYAQVAAEPGKADIYLGVMDSEPIAQHVVDLHNARLEAT